MNMDWLTVIMDPMYTLGVNIWNSVLTLCFMSGIMGPANYTKAWSYTVDTFNPFFVAIAATMLNIFFYIGFCRTVGNLKENMTLETGLNIFIKMILGNAGINLALTFAKWLFGISGTAASVLADPADLSMDMMDLSAGERVFYSFFGIIFLVVAIVSAATVFITMYTRIIHLYLTAATGPLAISCIPGGPGIQNCFGAWVKELISKTTSIIAIILGVSLITKMLSGKTLITGVAPGLEAAGGYVQNMFLMMLVAAFIKGADSWIKKTFGL